jgi:hypothetical protein
MKVEIARQVFVTFPPHQIPWKPFAMVLDLLRAYTRVDGTC